MGIRRHIGQTLAALARPVLGSMVVSVAGLWVARQLLPVDVLAASNDVVGNYLQTLGSIYAVLLAFVVFVVWNQFNEARGFVEREANELLDLLRTAQGLPPATSARVKEQVRSYVEVVIGTEWESLACAGPTGPGAGAALLDQLWSTLQGPDLRDNFDRSLFHEVLKRIDDVSDARSNRLNSSRSKIPQALRILLYLGAVTVVGSMYLFAVPSFAIHATITAALAGAIAHVLFIVEDLDNCFHGHWQVSAAPFQRVLEQPSAIGLASAPARAALSHLA